MTLRGNVKWECGESLKMKRPCLQNIFDFGSLQTVILSGAKDLACSTKDADPSLRSG